MPIEIRVLDALLYRFLNGRYDSFNRGFLFGKAIFRSCSDETPQPVLIYDDDGRHSEDAFGTTLFQECRDQPLRLSREELMTFLRDDLKRLGEPFEERVALVRLLEHKNLHSEAMVDNLWVDIDPWEVRALLSQDRERGAQAAESSAQGGGNGSEPEMAPPEAAKASPEADGAKTRKPGPPKGFGDGTMIVHLRDIEGVVGYDDVRQILGIAEGVARKNTTDMYSRSKAAHTGSCPVCVHRQPLTTEVAARLAQWKQRRR